MTNITEIIHVDRFMNVTNKEYISDRCDWSGSISINIQKIVHTLSVGQKIWDVRDSDLRAELKMRGGKPRADRNLDIQGVITGDSFRRYQNKDDENRFVGKSINITCYKHHGNLLEIGRIGNFYYSTERGVGMTLLLPSDVLQFIHRNKKLYPKFETFFLLSSKWGFPPAPENYQEPYYKDPNNFHCEVTELGMIFEDNFNQVKMIKNVS